MKTLFISGHLSISIQEFEMHYADKIRDAVYSGHSFVVGDAPGVDAMAQQLLWTLRDKQPHLIVTVYHMFDTPRHNIGFNTKGGYKSDGARDAAMTDDSDEDIAWVRPGREYSGTALNLARRNKHNERNTN